MRKRTLRRKLQKKPDRGQLAEILLPAHLALAQMGTEHFRHDQVLDLVFLVGLAQVAAADTRNDAVCRAAAHADSIIISIRDGAELTDELVSQLHTEVRVCDRFVQSLSAARVIMTLNRLQAWCNSAAPA